MLTVTAQRGNTRAAVFGSRQTVSLGSKVWGSKHWRVNGAGWEMHISAQMSWVAASELALGLMCRSLKAM